MPLPLFRTSRSTVERRSTRGLYWPGKGATIVSRQVLGGEGDDE